MQITFLLSQIIIFYLFFIQGSFLNPILSQFSFLYCGYNYYNTLTNQYNNMAFKCTLCIMAMGKYFMDVDKSQKLNKTLPRNGKHNVSSISNRPNHTRMI